MRHSLTLARGLPCVILAWASISCAQGSAPSLDAVDAARRPTKDATRPDTALPDSSPADSSPADGSPADSTLPDSAPPDSSRVDGSRLDAGRDARAGGPDGAVADGGHGRDSSSGVPDARPDSSGPGSLRYLCPVQFSENCMDGSLCESTCLGQFQYTPTCTWYAMNAVPTPVTCTAVSHLTTVFSCPVQLSSNCVNASLCESTCVGQLQAAATCSTFGTGGVATNVSCTDETGKGSLPLYECPVVASTGCSNTSLCETTCVGQISTLSTCTYRGPSAVAMITSCTLLGDQTF